MAGNTLTLLAGALMKDYHKPIIDNLNNMTALMSLLDKDYESVSGEGLEAIVPIKLRRTQGIGAVAEGGALPIAKYTKTAKLTIGLAYNYGSLKFTGQSVAASRKSATAFANVIDLEVNDMTEAMKIDTNRQFYGDGSGWLCMTNGTGSSAHLVTVDNPGTQWLENGMGIQSFASLSSSSVDANDISYGASAGAEDMVGSKPSSTTFELVTHADVEASEDWATNRYIVRAGARDNEMVGLKAIVDNEAIKGTSSWYGLGDAITTIHGLSRATYPLLDATIVHNSNTNTNITEARIQELLDDIESASGKKGSEATQIMMTTHGVRKAYVDLIQADRRYVKPLELIGGWEAIGYQAGNRLIPMLVDRHCIPNTLFVLDRRYLKIYRASDYNWMTGPNREGNMFRQTITSSGGTEDAYEANMFIYQSLGCSAMKNNGALRDITEA